MLVSPVSIQKGDLGSVIVGGREFNRLKPEESLKRLGTVYKYMYMYMYMYMYSVQVHAQVHVHACVFHGVMPSNNIYLCTCSVIL